MKVSFYCNIHQSAFSILEFYKQDIKILKDLASQLTVVNKYRDIDWSSDVIFIWWWTYAFFPVYMAKLLKKKTIITGTFNYRAPDSPSDFYRRPFWQRCLIKYAMKKASCNILVSKHEFNQIQKDWKFPNLTYSPHIVDIEKYKPNSNIRQNYLFSIISSGKQSIERKCLPEIILAAKILSIKYPDLKYLVAGRYVDELNSVQNMINEHGLSSNIILLGEISEEKKIEYLQNCLIYLQPSRYEGFGLAIAEAMSCRSPIIASNVGEVKNVVGDCGVLLTGYSPQEIAFSIESLLQDKDLQNIIGIKARERVKQKFSYDIRKNDIQNVISQLLNKN